MARQRRDGVIEYYDPKGDGFAPVTLEYVEVLEYAAEMGHLMRELSFAVAKSNRLGLAKRTALKGTLRTLLTSVKELT